MFKGTKDSLTKVSMKIKTIRNEMIGLRKKRDTSRMKSASMRKKSLNGQFKQQIRHGKMQIKIKMIFNTCQEICYQKNQKKVSFGEVVEVVVQVIEDIIPTLIKITFAHGPWFICLLIKICICTQASLPLRLDQQSHTNTENILWEDTSLSQNISLT